MSVNTQSLSHIKILSKQDLAAMDNVIKDRLAQKEQLIQEITYHIINSGGKRLRPILSILSAKLFGYLGERHISLAAAVEFIHTATLLHDDVVDHSDLRRGRPTANRRWDNKSSILVGDFLFSQAFLLMSEDKDLNILAILSKAASVIAEGEVKQLSSIANLELDLKGYLQIISAKTAELFAASCQVGAAVAKTSEELQLAMYNFGLNLGIAFQIIDDVLDYMASEFSLGKSIGDDFKEGKVTLPIIIAYRLSNEEEKLFWQRVMCNHQQNSQDFDKALDIFAKYNVIEECLKMTTRYASLAKECISSAPDNQIKKALIEVLDFSTSRCF
jgi:octaprenyl-diphosphate synthase